MEFQALTQRFDGVLLALLVFSSAGGDEGRDGECVGSGGKLWLWTRTELHYITK